MGKISFVLHGKIRGKKLLFKQIRSQLGTDHELCFFETEKANHAEKLSLQALNENCDYLIAVGGDGTLNEVVNGFLKAGGSQKFDSIIGILPWGTGNDFVKSSGNRKSVEQLADLINKKSVRKIDAGQIKYFNADGSESISYFDNIADLGIGAEVVSRVNAVHLRKVILGGTLLFFFTALKTFLFYRHKPVKVIYDGQEWEGRILSLVIANGQYFGSGLGVAPDAKIDDGQFELVIFGDLSVIDYLKNYGKIRKSQKLELSEVFYFRAKSVKVESLNQDVVLEADGEVGGKAPLMFTCLQGAIPLLAPRVD